MEGMVSSNVQLFIECVDTNTKVCFSTCYTAFRMLYSQNHKNVFKIIQLQLIKHPNVRIWQIWRYLDILLYSFFFLTYQAFWHVHTSLYIRWWSYLGQGKWECSQTGQWFPRWPAGRTRCSCGLWSSRCRPHSQTRLHPGSRTRTGNERDDRWDGRIKKMKQNAPGHCSEIKI